MKKNSLSTAMSKAAARTPQFGRSTNGMRLNEGRPDGPVGVERPSLPMQKSQRPAGRVGKKVISGFFDPKVSKQLARLAIDHDRSQEDLLREALNDLFTKYQLPPIA